MTDFAANLRRLPAVDHIARLELTDATDQRVGVIENRPGSAGSVAVYHAVSRTTGWIDRSAAEQALTLYAEHVADARAQPGRHPNIDRLFALITEDGRLRVHCVTRADGHASEQD